MFRTSTHRRVLLVALVAMAGMVLGAPADALGSSGGSGGSCCASPMPEGCQCCEAIQPAALPRPQFTPTAPAPSLSGSASSCECRPAPAQPARSDSRSDSRTTEDRSSDPIDELPLDSALRIPRRALTSSAFGSPPPPRAALYLRVERLLL
jgi:hypothetical protein